MGKSKDLATGAAYQDQTESDTRYVNASGDTMSGTLNVNGGDFSLAPDDAAANRYMFLNTGASQDGHIILRRALSNKHQLTTKADGSFNIYGYDAFGDVFNINSSGIVTKPYQPSFRASNGTTSIAGSGTSFGCATVHHNIGNHYNTTGGVFTAPVAGSYIFSYSITPLGGNVSSNAATAFLINGGTQVGAILDYSAADSSTQSIVIYLNANDYVQAWAFGANNGSWTAWSGANMQFSGCLIG